MLEKYFELLNRCIDALSNLQWGESSFSDFLQVVGYELQLIIYAILFIAGIIAIIAMPVLLSIIISAFSLRMLEKKFVKEFTLASFFKWDTYSPIAFYKYDDNDEITEFTEEFISTIECLISSQNKEIFKEQNKVVDIIKSSSSNKEIYEKLKEEGVVDELDTLYYRYEKIIHGHSIFMVITLIILFVLPILIIIPLAFMFF